MFNRIISFSKDKDGFLSFEEIQGMVCNDSDDEDLKIEAAKNALWRWGKENDLKKHKNLTKISREEFLEAQSK